jgi:hypothetical protein
MEDANSKSPSIHEKEGCASRRNFMKPTGRKPARAGFFVARV